MLAFYLLLCFKIHTNQIRTSDYRLQDGFPINECRSITHNKNEDRWHQYGSEDVINNDPYYIKCDNGGKIVLSGGGISMVRTFKTDIDILPHGLIDVSNANFECFLNEIYASGAMSRRIQLIHFRGSGEHSIYGTSFRFCGIGTYEYVFENNITNPNQIEPADWDPTLIFIEGNSNNIFTQVNFTHPKTGTPQGWVLRPVRCIKCISQCNINISNSNFYNATAFEHGAFLYLGTTGDSNISISNFQECFDRHADNNHAIYISTDNTGSVSIKSSIFRDCGKFKNGYVITSYNSKLAFEGNTVEFTDIENCSRCVRCYKKGTFIFNNNNFTNIKPRTDGHLGWVSSAIHYEPQDTNNEEEHFELSGNNFMKIEGTNQGRCVYAVIKEERITEVAKNFVSECPVGGFCIKFKFETAIYNLTMNGWEFRNNAGSDTHGGGTGIWIENPIHDKSTDPFTLIIKSCVFDNNHCTKKGGALQFGNNGDENKDKFQMRIEIQLTDCTFRNNVAEEGGGALYVSTTYPLTISNCHFINNRSPQNGGAIYIKTDINDFSGTNQHMTIAEITGCDFTNNSGNYAHCIYIIDGSQTQILVRQCTFNNNYNPNLAAGSCILSNAIELTVSDSIFENDNLETASGGVNVTSRSTLSVSNSQFIHCTAGNVEKSFGGGIGYCTSVNDDSSRTESIKIERNCIFDGNGGANGVAIGLKPVASFPQISDVTIKNHDLTNWIFFIFFYFETDNQEFELNRITFDRNSFDSGRYSEFGGGTGIWIAESEDVNYIQSFNLCFNDCVFSNNYSPENGGALSYGGSPRLESVELTLNGCRFENNRCDQYYGGACRFETSEPVSIIGCTFINNRAESSTNPGVSGGGAIFFGSTVSAALIHDCIFDNCFAYRGSFIFTNGAMKNISVSKCTFQNLQVGQSTSVYIMVDQQVTQFTFDSNTFTGLSCTGPDGGAGLHVLNGDDCEISNCKFINCIGGGIEYTNNNGIIRIPDPSTAQLLFSLCEFNNEQKSHSQDARAIYIANNAKVRFNSCSFLGYDQSDKDGAVLKSQSETCTIFYNCSFLALEARSLMNMPKALSVDISSCQFSNCQMGDYLIIAGDAQDFKLDNNTFSDDSKTINIEGKATKATVSYNKFLKCKQTSAIVVNSPSLSLEVFGNTFTECRSDSDGSALRIEDSTHTYIHDCVFTDNNQGSQNDCYTIYTKSNNLEFTDSIIKYTGQYYGSGIKIGRKCIAEITSVQFLNLHRPSAIYYDGAEDRKDNVTLETVVSNCTFDNFKMIGSASLNTASYSVFCFGDNLGVVFTNNTIRNHQLPSSEWAISIGKIEDAIDNCTFEGNTVNSENGGGIGVEFIRANARISDCVFIRNHANISTQSTSGKGGAVKFSKTSIEIENCVFNNNLADYEGGAISIESTSSLIYNCQFTDNHAAQQNFGNNEVNNKMGGAIYYESPTTEEHLLKECIFTKNSAFSNGHAIYINGPGTTVHISDLCQFQDNSQNGGSQIVIDGKATLDFSNSTVSLSEESSFKARGIELMTGSLNAHNTTFSNIQAPDSNGKIEGNAILVNRGNNEATIEYNLFMDCYINNKLSYAVTFNGSRLNFIHNTFDFSSNKGCGCLRVYTTGNIIIEENIFRNANTPSGFSGVLYYEELERLPQSPSTKIRYNTFEKCTSQQTACFKFKWISQDYEFTDNSFQNNVLDNYLGEFDFMGKKINGTFYCGGNSFINNSAKSRYGGGSGLWFQNKPSANEYLLENHFSLFIEDCRFIGNHAIGDNFVDRNCYNGRGGAIQLGWTESMSNIDVSFRNTTFERNIADREGGAISVQVIGYVLIQNCTFNGNLGGHQDSFPQDTKFGGAVFIYPDFPFAAGHYAKIEEGLPWIYSDNITISNSIFKNNSAKDANAIYFKTGEYTDFYITDSQFIDNHNVAYKNYSIVSEAREFIFEKSSFDFANRFESSSSIRTESITTITKSHFHNSCVLDTSMAETIFVDPSVEQITISETIFEDCGVGGNGYNVIKLNSPSAIIKNSVINFTDNSGSGAIINNQPNSKYLACKPIYIYRYCDLYLYGNRFTKSLGNGCFYYKPTFGNKDEENVHIEKNIFEQCIGAASRAMCVELQTSNITFYNNTIQDCSLYQNAYLIEFYLPQIMNEFTLDSIIFRNLETNSPYGGGSGSWFQMRNKRYDLIFRDCTFENNHASYSVNNRGLDNGKGGALQYGWTESISNIDLTIERCHFLNNKADQEGGALCLMIQGNIEITECTFEKNIAGLTDSNEYLGGAIAIFPNYGYKQNIYTESVNIAHCTFKENLGHNANAIFVQDGSHTNIAISDKCQFIDNTNESSQHACVMVEARELEIDDCNFEFTFKNTSCNAIDTNATNLLLNSVVFRRCVLPGKAGNALVIRAATTTSIINNCQFIDSGNNQQGSVIYTEAASFEYTRNLIDFPDFEFSDRGMYIPNICKFHLSDSTFHHCRFSQQNNGAAFLYEGKRSTGHTEDIVLENVTFNNNSSPYASCFFMKPLLTIPVLKDLTIKNHQHAGNFVLVIVFPTNLRKDITLERCTFDNNLYNKATDAKPDCGGSGLWIAPAQFSPGYKDSFHLIFNQCKFLRNRNNLRGGALSYGYSNTLRYIFLDFNTCTFEDNTCDGQFGGALSVNGSVPVTISKCVFKGNKAVSAINKGHCIYADRRARVVISESSFIDNGLYNYIVTNNFRETSGFSIIQCSGAQLDMNNCNMSFTDPSITNSRFIDIDYCSTVNLVNSTFTNCSAGTLWGGAIHLNKETLTITDEQITIDSCIFDNNDAGNGCSILLNTSSVPIVNNLTFRNQPKGKFVFAVFFIAFRDACTIENTVFENSTSSGEDGGGSAMWVANQEEISHGRPFELTFSKCVWRNNAATKRGGAIHYGNSKTLVGVQMTFEKCQFLNNHAKEEGGAVSLVTKSPIVFSDCVFSGNYVESKTRAGILTEGTKGGSISVNSKTPLVQITSCSFTNETSDQGNAIFIHSNVQACLISLCTFKNCGKMGTAIVTETPEFMFLNSEVIFDRRLQACRAIEIRTIAVTTISKSTFRNCYTENIGAGIYLNNTLQSEEQEDFTLEDTVFDACQAITDGCAFFLNVSSSPVIRGLTIQNHKFDINTSVILNYYDFQDLFTLFDCKFRSNSYQNTRQQDGGGSAIFIANGIKSSYESSYRISFVGCTWTKNSGGYGGAFSSGIHTLHDDTELSFERCTFTDNYADYDDGGALFLKTKQMIFFDDCTFSKNRCHSPENLENKCGGAIYIVSCSNLVLTATTFAENYAYNGNAIWVEDIPTAEITDCTFNSNNDGRVGAQIASKSAELIIRDTTFEFNPKKAQARGIEILLKCQSTFANCQFSYCNATGNQGNGWGGAIHILNNDASINRTESLTLESCIFDKCDANNGAVIQGTISCNPTFKKCTISNCGSQIAGHFIIAIFFDQLQQFVTIDECTFLGNYFKGTSSSDAGGIGFWIAHQTGLDADSLSIKFLNCHFISNHAAKNGGVLGYGNSPRLKNISLTFEGCTFNDNVCDGGQGGALYIQIERAFTVTGCHFISNKCNGANTRGSAIYMESPSELCSIRDSTFESGQAIDGAIYAQSVTNNLAISDCKFINCASSTTGSAIYSAAGIFNIHSCDIIFEETSTIQCRGIFVKDKADVTISQVNLINCKSSGTGGGLNIDFTTGNREESLLINTCLIDNADGTNGCAAMINTNFAPDIDGLTIRNCTSGRYVFCIFFTTYVYEAKIKNCIFENNEFANNAYPPIPDGGGSGVWIANNGIRDDDKEKHLIFEGCTWLNNRVKDNSALKYGGGFSLGTSLTTKITELEFKSCRFINNFASERGGGLYLATSLPVTINNCLFDGNEAEEGSSIYTETTSNVTIQYTQMVRGKTTSNGAAFIKSSQQLNMLNVTFTENTGGSPNSLYLENEGTAVIENCNFDITRTSEQYQIRLAGESSSASITFRMGCFIHKGSDSGNTHIYSTHKGQINLPAGNCFDSSQSSAISNHGGSINAGAGVFDCNKCGSIYVPTIAPDATPSASPSISIDTSSSIDETEIPTAIPTSSSSSGAVGPPTTNKSNKKKMKTIGMIAGITAAITVLICLIIILLWLFIFRKRSKAENNSDQNASEMNDEQITEISGIDPDADDPIWAGTNQNNPLFNGAGEDNDDGQMINNDFEESWGNVI